MKTTKDLTNKAIFSDAKLRAQGINAYLGDATATRANVYLETYQFDNSWVLAVATGGEQASFDIDRTMSNKAQAVLWTQLLSWFESLDMCDAAKVKPPISPQKVAKEVFEWAIMSIGSYIATQLKDRCMVADHPYLLVEFAEHGKKAIVNAYTVEGARILMNSVGTAQFLTKNPDAVIYPSVACTGLENTVLFHNSFVDAQIAPAKCPSANIPTKHANWLVAIEHQQKHLERNVWSINGVDSYAGFDQLPRGVYAPVFVDFMRLI